MICFVSSIGMLRCGSLCPVRSVCAKNKACVGQTGSLVLCGDILPVCELVS